MKKLFLALVLIVCMASSVMAAGFFIGDSTFGTSTVQPAVVGEAFSGRYQSEGAKTHSMYTVVAGDSITTANAFYQYGSGDSLQIGLYLAASDTVPDTLIKSWFVIQTNHDPAALTVWNLDYAIPEDNWGDDVILALILHYGAGFSVFNADSAEGGCFCMMSKDAVPDSLLPQTWVESATGESSPTFWFEGINVGGASNILKGKILEGKMPSSPMIGMEYGPPYDPENSDSYYTARITEVMK